MRAKVGVLVHHVDERALDEIGELERAAELAVALHALVHLASDLDAQGASSFGGSNLSRAMAISL